MIPRKPDLKENQEASMFNDRRVSQAVEWRILEVSRGHRVIYGRRGGLNWDELGGSTGVHDVKEA